MVGFCPRRWEDSRDLSPRYFGVTGFCSRNSGELRDLSSRNRGALGLRSREDGCSHDLSARIRINGERERSKIGVGLIELTRGMARMNFI